MMKSVLESVLAAALTVLAFSCTKEKDFPAPAPQKKTIHYSATVEEGTATRAVVGEDKKYRFEAGDRIYMETANQEMYGFLILSPTGEGKTQALFEGDLTCEEDFTPTSDTPVSLVLVGPEDELHTFSEDGKLTGTDYAGKSAPTLAEAVRRLSHFTGSGKFADLRFTIRQQSAFLTCDLTFNSVWTPSGTSVTAAIYNAAEDAALYQVSLPVSTVDGDSMASWVAPFASGISLSGARMVVSQTGRDDVVLKMADKELQASTYYSFQRTTFMQYYFTLEATQANTLVQINYADAADGFQYSFDGFEWKSYKKADGKITIPAAGDKLYLRSKRSTYQHTGATALITVDGNKTCYVYGDMMFLLCDDKYKPRKAMPEFGFQGLFYDCSWLRLHPDNKLQLTAGTLARGCYFEMFRGCANLTAQSSAQPASLSSIGMPGADVALAERCFDSMFYGCTDIKAIPEGFLPWTTLQTGCYRRMFDNCKNLVTVPSGLLPATTLAPHCYMNMFFNCFALEDAPELPATVPEPGCYFAMFRHCKVLKTVTCLVVLTKEQMSDTNKNNPDKSLYDDAAEPSPNNLSQWTDVSAWTVFNKWLNDVPNDNKRVFTKNSAMTFPRDDGVGGIPAQWQVVNH